MSRTRLFVAAAVVMAVCGCSTAPKTERGRVDLENQASAALARAQGSDPSLTNVLRASAGYAVFPSVGKGGIGVGGAYGQGILFAGGQMVGYCDLSQTSIGAQLGGQSYTEIICFETGSALGVFQRGGLSFDAQATAVSLQSGAGANAKYRDAVEVFTMGESGLMFEASIGGQSFTSQPR